MQNDFAFKRISSDYELRPFDCGDADLNDFFRNDAKSYLNQLLAVTYIIENESETVAFFSVLNDTIINKDLNTDKIISNQLNRNIPNDKRRPSYPAVKIGRFAVHKNYQRQKNGSKIIDFIKAFFTINNKTGCRFITVDAYKKAIDFYKKNGFRLLTKQTKQDEKEDTILMYFDLKTFVR